MKYSLILLLSCCLLPLSESLHAQSFQEDLTSHLKTLNAKDEIAFKIDYRQVGVSANTSFTQSLEVIQRGINFSSESPNGYVVKQDSVLLYVDTYQKQVIVTTATKTGNDVDSTTSNYLAINAAIDYQLVEETASYRKYEGKDQLGNTLRARFDKVEVRFSESEIVYDQPQRDGVVAIQLVSSILNDSSLPWLEDILEIGKYGLQLTPKYHGYSLTGS